MRVHPVRKNFMDGVTLGGMSAHACREEEELHVVEEEEWQGLGTAKLRCHHRHVG
jgi:hypothetical protein